MTGWPKFPVVAFLALFLTGCVGMRLQDEAAGTTRVNIKGCETTAGDAAGTPYICEIKLVDGKARKDVELTATRGDITIQYSAKEATVEGQAARVLLHGAMVSAFTDILPQLMGVAMAAQGLPVPAAAPVSEEVE